MSNQTLKQKVMNGVGANISGKPPGGIWVSQGPFGSKGNVINANNNGFSLNGGIRPNSFIGKTYAVSVNGTSFKGIYPVGHGGTNGRYPKSQPVMNSPLVLGQTQGQQFMYIKPSVLSTKGMLERQYKWINNGQYPNYWVQPVYPNCSLSDNASQGVYLDQKAAANMCFNDINRPQVYAGYIRKGGSTGCNGTTAKYTFDTMSANAQYTKFLYLPRDYSQYNLQIQRKCANPLGPQKPFPFAANNGNNGSVGVATGAGAPSSGPPIPTMTPVYLTPPAWYTGELTLEEALLQQSVKENLARAAALTVVNEL
jgi:hypothetical protein